MRAISRGEPFQTLPFVRPGGDILLRLDGWPKVQRALAVVDAVEGLGLDPADVSPDYWRHAHNRLAANLEPNAYTPERHAAWIGRRRIGSVVEIGPAETASRPSDRSIAVIAEDGIYRPSRHLEQAKFEGRVPGGDYEGYVDAHVRRLEALRRGGIVERIDADQWRIPQDFEGRAAAYDAGRNRQASVRVLSVLDLEKQIGADGATWLDRRLVSPDASDLASAGFGQQVREAMDQRRDHHIEHGDAALRPDGRTFYRRNLLATLREREVASVGAEIAASKAVPFRAATDGETVSGKFTGTVQLASGKFAIVEKAHEFTLVPWRPVIDRQLGREVMGVVQGGAVSWQMGRHRGISL